MYQGQPMYPTVGNFHMEVLQILYDYPSFVSAEDREELEKLAIVGLKEDMKLLADQRADFRKNLEKAEELRARVELCPMCGTYLNAVPESEPDPEIVTIDGIIQEIDYHETIRD